ncbi:MAG: S-layer family protein [Cyanobacteria bacterium J06606_4]
MHSYSQNAFSLPSLSTVWALGVGFSLAAGWMPISASAQSIATDGTTPTTLTGVNSCAMGSCVITGGTLSDDGAGLFHSFRTFNIEAGESVTFQPNAGVEMIFTRVSELGPLNLSNIDGELAVDGAADLFLLNPNGIIFGSGASLNLEGSFVATTADSFVFQENAEFGVSTATVPSLLNIRVPIGLQFGSSPGPIQAEGPGNNTLSYNLGNATIDRVAPTQGLMPGSEETIALLGGQIDLEGSTLAADMGHVEIGGLGENSFVVLAPNVSEEMAPLPGWNFDYSAATDFEDITLSQRTAIDVSGDNAGSVHLQGRNVMLSEGSAILGKVITSGGGQIVLDASESLRLEGVEVSAADPMLTGILLEVAPGAEGDGSSHLLVNASLIDISNGAQIGLGMGGLGTSGRVEVFADTINVDNGTETGPSSLYAAVLPVIFPPPGATGEGGDLTITTGQLNVTNGAQITASTFTTGDAGNLTIYAGDVRVVGRNDSNILAVSSIRSSSELPPIPGLSANGSGAGGELLINTGTLLVADGGQVAVATISNNPAGNLTVNARESVELRGRDENGRSGLFASALSADGLPPSTGEGGTIAVNIESGRLVVAEGATINASNFASEVIARTASGNGAAGDIDLVAEGITLQSGGLITASTVAGDRGNINLTAGDVVLREESQVTTNATGSATGGNIDITTGALIALENSDITANATSNFGGRVVVDAQTILGTAYREQLTPDSDITATSALGPDFSGSVELNTPDIDPASGLVSLPENVDDTAQVVAACENLGSNTFVATGRGGLPVDASQLISGRSLWNDFRIPQQIGEGSAAKNELSDRTHQNEAQTVSHPIEPIGETPVVEAQAWTVNSEGEVVLGMHSMTTSSAEIAARGSSAHCLANR